MTKDEIRHEIMDILKNRFQIDEEKLVEGNSQKPLTGKTFQMAARDMVYLFFEVEKRFRIQIAPHEIEHYEFNTIDGIVGIVEQKLLKI